MHTQRSIPWIVILSFLSNTSGARAESAGGAAFVPLGDLPGGDFFSIATHVSADGSTVVGDSRSSDGANPYEAFRWTEAGGLLGLGGVDSPPGTRGRGVSADGSVIVMSGPGPWPILWTESGGAVEVPDTTGTMQLASPRDLSADGNTIVGSGWTVVELANQGFRWTPTGGYEPLGFLPSTTHDSFMTDASRDGAVLSGFSFHQGFDVEPTKWTQATGLDSLGDVPGGDPYALAWGISGDGTTIVGDAHIGGTSEPWLWREQIGFVRPDPSHGANGGGWFEATSFDGEVAVGAPAIVWNEAQGIQRIADVLSFAGIDVSAWLLISATDVSDDGRTIVGYGLNPAGDTEAWLARLPELIIDSAPLPGGETVPALALVPLDANPTRRTATFRLSLSGRRRLLAQVLSVDGRVLRTLADGSLGKGEHVVRWDGRNDAGARVAAGIYFLRVFPRDAAITRKIVRLD